MAEPWAYQVAPGSKLYYAPESKSHASRFIEDVLVGLQRDRTIPDEFIPESFMQGLTNIESTGWRRETDHLFNFVEELADVLYQIMKFAIGDNKTVGLIKEARALEDKDQSRSSQQQIINERLSTTPWLEELAGTDNLPILTKTFIAAMDSREVRGVPPDKIVQPASLIWQKLFAGLDDQYETIEPEERKNNKRGKPTEEDPDRMSEAKELLLAAEELDKKTGLTKTEDVRRFLYWLAFNGIYSPSDETRFYSGIQSAIQNELPDVFQGTNITLPDIIKLALRKQTLRMEIGIKLRERFTGTDFDTRAATKIITQFCLPYLIAQIIPDLSITASPKPT